MEPLLVRVKTWIIRIAIGAVLGAVLTVAVAWYFAVDPFRTASGARQAVVRDESSGGMMAICDERLSAGARYRSSLWASDRHLKELPTIERPGWLPDDVRPNWYWSETHVGWPLLAMSSGYHMRTFPGGSAPAEELPSLTVVVNGTSHEFPILPRWGPFIANTALGCLVYVLLATAAANALGELRGAGWRRPRWFAWGAVGAAALLFGAIMTFGVAWRLAARAGTFSAGTSTEVVSVAVDSTTGMQVQIYEIRRAFGFYDRVAGNATPVDDPDAATAAAEVRRTRYPLWLDRGLTKRDFIMQEHVGWPMLALKSGHNRGRTQYPRLELSIGSIDVTLPVIPVWPGFAVNVLAYAALAGAGAFGVHRLRRRRATGRCSKCQYDLQGLPSGTPCPECGAPTSPAAGSAAVS